MAKHPGLPWSHCNQSTRLYNFYINFAVSDPTIHLSGLRHTIGWNLHGDSLAKQNGKWCVEHGWHLSICDISAPVNHLKLPDDDFCSEAQTLLMVVTMIQVTQQQAFWRAGAILIAVKTLKQFCQPIIDLWHFSSHVFPSHKSRDDNAWWRKYVQVEAIADDIFVDWDISGFIRLQTVAELRRNEPRFICRDSRRYRL